MGGKKQQQKKKANKHKGREDHQTQQKGKNDDRKSKRQLRKEKEKFNVNLKWIIFLSGALIILIFGFLLNDIHPNAILVQKDKYEQDLAKFKLQLATFGLKLKEITGDGNCLFRAIADQIEGNEKLHRKYRADAVEYIEANKDEFAPFIEDDETIEQYAADMAKDSIWGGQMEIQALSMKYNFNIIVHQVDNPIMLFSNFPLGSVPTIHISYHLGEHYNSVRLKEDEGGLGTPAMPIGHDLKQISDEELQDLIAQNKPQEEQKKEQKQTTTNGSTVSTNASQDDQFPSREYLIAYTITVTGMTQRDIMREVLETCFGKEDNVTYENIEQTMDAIKATYEEIEMQQVTSQFGGMDMNGNQDGDVAPQASLNGTKSPQKDGQVENKDRIISQEKKSEKDQAGNKEKDKISKDVRSKVTKLQMNDELIVNEKGEISTRPPMNRACPCDSKLRYKKCCYSKDQNKKQDFIDKATNKVNKQIQNGEILGKQPAFLQL